MRRFPLALPGAALLMLALGGCDRQKPAAGQDQAGPDFVAPAVPPAAPAPAWTIDRSRAGQPASGARFIGPDDAAATLADFRGTPVLLNLWATWCAPCIAEMPALDRLAAARAGELTVVTVAQDIQGAAVVDPWFARANYRSLQPWLDPENRLLADYNSALPVSVLIDAAGRERWRITGALAWDGAEAAALLAEAGD